MSKNKRNIQRNQKINVYDDYYLYNTGCKYYMSPTQNNYYTDFSINRFSTKEAQTFSHNLTLCKFLLLATCFRFWKVTIRQL